MAVKIPESEKINHFFKHQLGWSWIREMPVCGTGSIIFTFLASVKKSLRYISARFLFYAAR